jgi:UDP-N-acetylglucosamine diphosphorylase / glucose-1-phosphate thymidylyltransferase / UDP-N-acetylgalactosamine diphosphorylase / glucosamine-1-phosphate N-acetyltransferase / galactosamine-1-phosphate N-acetyltransferase
MIGDFRRHGWPLTLTRKIEDFPIGNVRLEELDAIPELHWLIEKGRYPWDLLGLHELYLERMRASEILGEVHPNAVVEGNLKLGKGSRVLPGVFIEGNVVIGENCKIGPNCYIRGATSIGDSCHIGQSVEIKNSIILDRTNVGHLSYVGDSILGEGVNFGAGTIVSNLRHDGETHRSMVEGTLVDTGRRKLGVIVGDGVHTGIGTLIYPGRKIWPAMTTRPGEVVARDLAPAGHEF